MKNFHKTIKIIFVFIILTSIVFPFTQEVQARKKIDDPMYFTPQIGIGDDSNFQVGEKIKIDEWTFVDYVITIYDWAIKAIVLLAIVMIMYSGFKWMMAGGNASSITKARDQIISALIGLVLAIGSYALLNFINPSLVNFQKLKIDKINYVELSKDEPRKYCKDISVENCSHYAFCEVEDNICIDKSACGIQDWMDSNTDLDCCELERVDGTYDYTYAQIGFDKNCSLVCNMARYSGGKYEMITGVPIDRCDKYFCDKVTECSKCATQACCLIARDRCQIVCTMLDGKCISPNDY